MSSLTALEVKRAASQRTDEVRTLNDGQGLNLVIPVEGQPGNPRWMLRFSYQGKESMHGLGSRVKGACQCPLAATLPT